VRVHVAFTPAEAAAAPVAVVVDVVRATSTISQALAAGTPRVLCCAEIDEALALKAALGEGLTGGERNGVRIEGFDVGASPRDFVEPLAEPLILVARSFPDALTGLNAARTDRADSRPTSTSARASVLDVVPRFAGRIGTAAEIVA
jgi:hypothetical protein